MRNSNLGGRQQGGMPQKKNEIKKIYLAHKFLVGRRQGGMPQKKKNEIKKNYLAHKFLVVSKNVMNRNSTKNQKVKEFQEFIYKHYGAVF